MQYRCKGERARQTEGEGDKKIKGDKVREIESDQEERRVSFRSQTPKHFILFSLLPVRCSTRSHFHSIHSYFFVAFYHPFCFSSIYRVVIKFFLVVLCGLLYVHSSTFCSGQCDCNIYSMSLTIHTHTHTHTRAHTQTHQAHPLTLDRF